MTVKAFAFLTAKPGMSRADYVDYYETWHTKLTLRLMTGVLDYRRNHVMEGEHFGEAPGFSTVTEFWFKDRESFDATMGMLADPETARLLAEDEAKVFDGTKTQMFLVEEFGPDRSLDLAEVDVGQRMRLYYETYNQRNADDLVAFYHEDIVLEMPGGAPAEIVGRDALLSTYRQMQRDFVDLMQVRRMMVSGNIVFVDAVNLLTAKAEVAAFFGRSLKEGDQLTLLVTGVYEWAGSRIRRATLHPRLKKRD